jgi:hypothetical protein
MMTAREHVIGLIRLKKPVSMPDPSDTGKTNGNSGYKVVEFHYFSSF